MELKPGNEIRFKFNFNNYKGEKQEASYEDIIVKNDEGELILKTYSDMPIKELIENEFIYDIELI